jgi:hypothetical protein
MILVVLAIARRSSAFFVKIKLPVSRSIIAEALAEVVIAGTFSTAVLICVSAALAGSTGKSAADTDRKTAVRSENNLFI